MSEFCSFAATDISRMHRSSATRSEPATEELSLYEQAEKAASEKKQGMLSGSFVRNLTLDDYSSRTKHATENYQNFNSK